MWGRRLKKETGTRSERETERGTLRGNLQNNSCKKRAGCIERRRGGCVETESHSLLHPGNRNICILYTHTQYTSGERNEGFSLNGEGLKERYEYRRKWKNERDRRNELEGLKEEVQMERD